MQPPASRGRANAATADHPRVETARTEKPIPYDPAGRGLPRAPPLAVVSRTPIPKAAFVRPGTKCLERPPGINRRLSSGAELNKISCSARDLRKAGTAIRKRACANKPVGRMAISPRQIVFESFQGRGNSVIVSFAPSESAANAARERRAILLLRFVTAKIGTDIRFRALHLRNKDANIPCSLTFRQTGSGPDTTIRTARRSHVKG